MSDQDSKSIEQLFADQQRTLDGLSLNARDFGPLLLWPVGVAAPEDELTARVWHVLQRVPDPEIPVVSIVELGMVRQVKVVAAGVAGAERALGRCEVTVTPTYSGCPATALIAQNIRTVLKDSGFDDVTVHYQLAPAWTTDWIMPQAATRLREFGIAPPSGEREVGAPVVAVHRAQPEVAIPCPRCGSSRTRVVSQFGSTPCKALYRCMACQEPFDYFKPH